MNQMIKYGLIPNKLNDICDWCLLEKIFSRDYSCVSSMNKAKKYGFVDFVDTEDMFIQFLVQLQNDRIIPKHQT